jgi:putative peptidoglycan lipid II flippase
MNIRRVVNASLLIGVFFGIDKILGLARQVLTARTFGVSAALDALHAANNMPDLVFAIISGSALAMAFIPVLSETLDREGRARAWDLFSRVTNWAFVLTAVLALLIAIFAEPLVRTVLAPGFSPAQQATTAGLMRLDLAALLIFSISGLVMGALQAHQHFLLPAVAPLCYNAGQIVGVVFLTRPFGVYGLAYGVILGAALHLAVQVPGLVHYGFRWTPALDWKDPTVRRVAVLMGPRMLTLVAIYIIQIFTDRLASGLGVGAVAALAYGWLIMQLPETVIGTAVGTALLPTLSELAAHGDRANLRRLLRRAFGVLLALTVPATVASLVLVRPAVKLVFEGRAFTAQGTALVVAAAQMYLLGVAGHSLVETAVRAFYAVKDALTPLFTAVFTLALFVGLCAVFIPRLGFPGIALANITAYTSQALLLGFVLWRRKLI